MIENDSGLLSNQRWKNLVLRLQEEARTTLHSGRRGSFASVCAHVLVNSHGTPLLWVVPSGVECEEVAPPRDWRKLAGDFAGESRDTLRKSRHGLAILSLTLEIGHDGALYGYKMPPGLRVEPAKDSASIFTNIVGKLTT